MRENVFQQSRSRRYLGWAIIFFLLTLYPFTQARAWIPPLEVGWTLDYATAMNFPPTVARVVFPSPEAACTAKVDAMAAYVDGGGGTVHPSYVTTPPGEFKPVCYATRYYPDIKQSHCDANYCPNLRADVMLVARACPLNSHLSINGYDCDCDTAFEEDDVKKSCVPKKPQMCKFAGAIAGNPILPGTGEKYRSEVDWNDAGAAPLALVRTYRSSWGNDSSRSEPGPSFLGKAWTHNYSWSLKKISTVVAGVNKITAAEVSGPDGSFIRFAKDQVAGEWRAINGSDELSESGGQWIFKSAETDAILTFAADGKLQARTARDGFVYTFTYEGSGHLAAVSNNFGRALTFAYINGKLAAVTTPDGRTVGYTYDTAGRLASVVYPDNKSRSFIYEDVNFPRALTGIIDEVGVRWGTFGYDAQGRAIRTELAGGVSRYQVSYPSELVSRVVDPLNTNREYGYKTTKGSTTITSGSLPSGEGEVDAVSRVQDANGLTTSSTDFEGIRTDYGWDVNRRLRTSVTEASNSVGTRTTTTEWHSQWRVPVLVTNSGSSTAFTYDTQGRLSSKSVIDTLVTPSSTKTWSWTYNPQGLVATASEPNGAISAYTYDTRGNVLTVTNALGHVVAYTYDTANRVTSRIEPNGLSTTYAYDARDRLLSQTVAGQQTTTLTYKPFGSIESATLPSGLVITYTYDLAHRLTGWSNNRGESGSYTLDAIGNRIGEQVKNNSGAIAWDVARVFNNINRLVTETIGNNQSKSIRYNSNGDSTIITNGLNQSILTSRDTLRRVGHVQDLSTNSAAFFKYNALDAPVEMTDFANVKTLYERDAQGNATHEGSNDIGSRTTQYDSFGLPSQITDSLGQATTITRDALGRSTSLVFADGKTTTLRYDLTTNSKGYLSEVIDRSGTTEYTRDVFGRVTLKKQTLINGSVQQVSYAYRPNGALTSISYPNGGTLTHLYDTSGRLTSLNWNGMPLVTNIAWNPLGQPTAWTWSFANAALAASRIHDTAGRMTVTEFSSYVYDAAGRITSLTQNLYQPGDADPTHNTIGSGNTTWSVDYDSFGRVAGFNATGNTASFGYGANGNRLSSTSVVNGESTDLTYSVGYRTNQLTGFSQTINGSSSTNVTYGYNDNGDMVSDGLRSFAYDAEGRLAASTTGATDTSPTTRYAHNALGQRVFKTEPLYPPSQGDEADPGFMQSLIAFFTKLWSPSTTQVEQLGYAYVYDEQGTLIAEVGSGGTNSAGQAQYIYLPTANGPMPIAAVIDGATYAVHSDHLNTPRRLTNASGQAVWQWSYSAFGEDKPAVAKNRFANLEVTPSPGTTGISEVKFNLRYPGQYADEESGLFYNGFRTYSPITGRYTQGDPIGLDGGWNRFAYVGGNPLTFSDPLGLFRVDGTPPEGLNPYQQREWGRMVKSLNDLGDRFQARINKACFVDRAKLQALFDAWVVKVDPRVFELRRNRSDYADTKNSRSTFYSGFFRDGDAYVSPASPGQPFTFAHEFRHMSPSNIAKGSANTTTKNRIFGQGAPDPAELDADQFAEAFWGTCPCGISN